MNVLISTPTPRLLPVLAALINTNTPAPAPLLHPSWRRVEQQQRRELVPPQEDREEHGGAAREGDPRDEDAGVEGQGGVGVEDEGADRLGSGWCVSRYR